MKKILSSVIAGILALSMFTASAFAASDDKNSGINTPSNNSAGEQTVISGDVNGDSKVTAKDSMQIQRYVINLVTLNDTQKKAADVDRNGKVTNADALNVLRYTINISVKYPIGQEVSDDIIIDESFEINGVAVTTLGDVFNIKVTDPSYGSVGNKFVYLLQDDNMAVRVIAELPLDVAQAYVDLSIFDNDYDAKVKKLLKDVKISQVDDFTDDIPTQKELNQFVGKTGKDLADAGYEKTGYFTFGNKVTIYYEKDFYRVSVVFDSVTGDMDLDDDSLFGDKTIQSITYESLSSSVLSF